MSRFFCFVYGASLAWFCSISFADGVEPTPNKASSPATTVPPQSSAKPGGGGAPAAAPGKPAEKKRPTNVAWLGDYAQAWEIADRQAKMLFVYFCKTGQSQLRDKFDSEALADPEVRKKLESPVRVRLPLDAKVAVDGHQTKLLEHPAFAEMLGLPGLAMIDLAHKSAKYYGHVVSVFPFLDEQVYSTDEMKVILDLPPGTLTQRTLIYAVRTHPEHPESTRGEFNPNLQEEAENHSQYQAEIRVQGHHFWENRFHRINGQLPGGCLASEVCAESWPGQGLLAAAVECVRCWRLSSGHWGAVRECHPVYGYDMKRGDNGVWYATGIFGRR
jgi:hypothetical protein